jgi:hypothetical protein
MGAGHRIAGGGRPSGTTTRAWVHIAVAGVLLVVCSCDSGGEGDAGSSTGARRPAPIEEPAFSRLGEKAIAPSLTASGNDVVIMGDQELVRTEFVRQRRDIIVIDTGTGAQTRRTVPETEIPTEFGNAVSTESGLLLLARPCPTGIEYPADVDNVGCERPSAPTTYLSPDRGRTWSEVPLPPNAAPPAGSEEPWFFSGEVLPIPDGRAVLTYTSEPRSRHSATTQATIFDGRRWSRAYDTGAESGIGCANRTELFLYDRSRFGAPPVLRTMQLDDGTVASNAVPVHPLDIAPQAQLACDRTGAALLSVGDTFTSNMAVHRLHDGSWVTEEIADSVGSVPNQVMSDGDAGIVVESTDNIGDRRERRVRLISAGTGATTVVRLSTRIWHIVPGLSGDRVALIGPFGPVSETAPARLRIETFK